MNMNFHYVNRARKLSLITFVLCIIATIAAEFISPSMIEDRIVDEELTRLKFVRQAIDAFQKQTGSFPSNENGTEQLARGGNPFLIGPVSDRWGRPYIYRRISTAPGYVVYSTGFNGIDEHGEGDDITTPDKKYGCKVYGVGCPPKLNTIVKGAILLISVFSLSVFVICLLLSAARYVRLRKNN
ncbi:MAG: type II secretion system protein GspG [Burkholderiaceae bacterium]|nr:type II secretion system protein GspG [Burkholderiaceae bacterium]